MKETLKKRVSSPALGTGTLEEREGLLTRMMKMMAVTTTSGMKTQGMKTQKILKSRKPDKRPNVTMLKKGKPATRKQSSQLWIKSKIEMTEKRKNPTEKKRRLWRRTKTPQVKKLRA